MRNIYLGKTIRTNLTQGTIINNCVSSEYEDCEVYGCIITPRCDLSNGLKVPTIHYLPIVTLKEWYHKYGIRKILENYKASGKGEFNAKFKTFFGIDQILDFKLSVDELKELVKTHGPKKRQKELLEVIKKYYSIKNTEIENFKPKSTDIKNLIKDLQAHKLSGYYLIEDWNSDINKISYRVILLREIKSFIRNIALKLKTGFLEEEFDESTLLINSFSVSKDKSNVYEIINEISSPYIEHIIQSFSHNFCRIGIEDVLIDDYDKLTNLK